MMAIADAMNMVEYVPLMMPTSIVNAKPRSTSPPNRYRDSTDRKVVPAVMTVRASVWFTLVLTTCSRDSRRIERRFTRTRSKTTMVAFTEYPVMVRMAATTLSDSSYPKNMRNASVTKMSWKVAAIAPTAKEKRKRNAMYRVMATIEASVA